MNKPSTLRASHLAFAAITALSGACNRSSSAPPPAPPAPAPTQANNGVNTALAVIGGLQRLAQASATPADGSTSATSHRGALGQRFTYNCPAGFTAGSVWGNGVYSDDSSVCAAGVHSGAITQAAGGLVTIEIRAGQDAYPGSPANGIVSQTFGQFPGSFAVVNAPSGSGQSPWSVNASSHRGAVGQRFTYVCPPGGTTGSVWGSGSYTDDSSVCTAAVHAGRITAATGGTVTIEIRPGQPSYMGSPGNGVTSSNYAQFPGSFVFP